MTKKKDKIIAGVRKRLKHDHMFHCLSRHTGKGSRKSLKRLCINSNDDERSKIIVKREEIEQEIMLFNTKHFKKAHASKVYDNKIHGEMRNNTRRDKMLSGELIAEDCDNENAFQFLKLSHQNGRSHCSKNRKILID